MRARYDRVENAHPSPIDIRKIGHIIRASPRSIETDLGQLIDIGVGTEIEETVAIDISVVNMIMTVGSQVINIPIPALQTVHIDPSQMALKQKIEGEI